MAVVTTYSTETTNHKSLANTKNPTTASEGSVFSSSATVAVAAGDDDTSTFYMLPVMSNWSIKSIKVYNDAITGGTGYDVGIYTQATTPVAVDDDCYASAISLATASTTGTEVAFEARNITAVNNQVWQDAGVASEPEATWYYLTLTADTVGTAAGDISVVVTYTV